jgi:ankyrin repeat protein
VYEETHKTIDLTTELDANSNTPCHWAALGGHVHILAFLVDNGFSIDAKNDDDDTPLHYAASGGSVGAVTLLLERRADPGPRNHANATPLHFAAAEGHAAAARLLLARHGGLLGTPVDQPTTDGDTPLHWAATSGLGGDDGGDGGVLAALLAAGADPNRPNHAGATPLHAACGEGAAAAVRALLRAGANQSGRTPRLQETPLHWAAGGGDSDGHLAAAQAVLDARADPAALDKFLEQPMHVAVRILYIYI